MKPMAGRKQRVAAALFVSLVALMAIPSPADAWTSPPGVAQVYYYPGPPPGGYLAGCIVESGLYKAPPGDSANVRGMPGPASQYCYKQGVQGVFLNTATNALYSYPASAYVYGYYGGTASVTGFVGTPIFGANYYGLNTNGWGTTWSVLVF